MMDGQTEQTIRERAYRIWIEAGRVSGLELEHWAIAERDVAALRKPAASANATKSKSTKAVGMSAKAKPATPKTTAKVATGKAAGAKAESTTVDAAAKTPKRAKAAEVRGTLN